MGMIKFGIGIAIKNNVEAVELYKNVFGMELGDADYFPEDSPNYGQYMHAEMWKDGVHLFDITSQSEEEQGFDPRKQLHGFGAYFRTEAELREAFDLLSAGGIITSPFGTVLPWSPCSASLIDKFGVSWWISVDNNNYP